MIIKRSRRIPGGETLAALGGKGERGMEKGLARERKKEKKGNGGKEKGHDILIISVFFHKGQEDKK